MADRRRRRRASQDSEEEEEESGSESAASVEKPGLPGRSENPERSNRTEPARDGDQSECESEDGIEGDAVLSDYESAEESEEEVEAHYSEEEPLKATLKPENNAAETTATKEEKVKTKGAVTGERQSGDGQESTEPEEIKTSKKSQKLDDDEDRKNPAYIPRKGLFFEHDLRGHTNDEEVRPKGRHPRKLWKDEGRWEHDRFREDEQAPKSRDELIAMYGYDIRSCRNPEEIRPRRPRKPRYSSPSRREDEGEEEEKPIRTTNRYISSSGPPPRTYNTRNSLGNDRAPSNRTYSRPGGYKENRPASYPPEETAPPPSTSDRRPDYGGYRARSIEQAPQTPAESLPEVRVPKQTEPVTEKQSDPSPPPPDRPIEKKSYSRARRSRIKGGEAGKPDDTTFPDLPPPPPPQIPTEVVPEPSPTMPIVKPGGWEPVDGGVSGLEQDMSQVNISEQNWSPGQAPYISARGIPNHIHMPGGPPAQYGMGGRVKRYSSQRQRPVPDPAPMHISLMEGHYYDPLQFQGPIYAHSDGPSPIPPQGLIVQQEMHLPHPGLHPHPTPAPMSTPNLYPPPVSIPPAQPPPPQQLLPPPYFTAPPGVINFGNPAYPTYPPGALPPPPPAHIYPNAQAQSQVYGGVTYYNPAQQQVQPKPSPPRRTSHPVTIKPPPPEDDRHLKMAKEKASA